MPSATTRALRPAIHITGESSRGVKAHDLATKTKDGQIAYGSTSDLSSDLQLGKSDGP